MHCQISTGCWWQELGRFERFGFEVATKDTEDGGKGAAHAVILQVWKLKGIVWSESVPSSPHLAWMCLQELHVMEEKLLDKADDDLQQGGETLNYRLSRDHCWSFNCHPVYDRIEFLLLVEFLKNFILENGEAIARDIKHKGFVDLGRQRRKMHILNVSVS